jgi:hypothetical protein
MLSASPVPVAAGTRPVVRKARAAGGAAGPATVFWKKRPRTGATPGNTAWAPGRSPRLDQPLAVRSWPTLLARRSVKIPYPARTTPLGL